MMNPTMLAVLGYAEDEVAGANYLETFVPEPDREPLAKVFDTLVSLNEPTLNENHVLTKDGRQLLVEWHGRPVFKETGEFDFFFGVGIDITERKQAEERERRLRAELAHMGRLKTMGEMAGGLAHELGQPVASIAMLAEAAARRVRSGKGPSEESLLETLEDMAVQGRRAGELIRRMKDFVKKVEPRKSPLVLSEAVGEVMQLVEKDLQLAGVTVTIDMDRSLPTVLADKIQLQQVLLNLVRNALEAIERTQPGPRQLYIAATARHDELEIAVRDTGCGFPEEAIDDLFTTFYTTKAQGMGLGLAISRSIVEAHRGRIWGRPNAGRGSTFNFTLPIAAGDADD